MSVPLALTMRGARVEGIHRGSAVVTDVHGSIVYSEGDPEFATYMRSSVKMFQAIPVVVSGAVDKFSLTNAELSICCASHIGAEYHIATVGSILSKIGLDEPRMACGSHEPFDTAERNRIIVSQKPPTQIHNNCSGKHAGMLAACKASDWTLDDYASPEHPLQKFILEFISSYTGVAGSSIGTAVDGCSLPTYYLPIHAAATAMARFTDDALMDGSSSPGRIFHAMNEHPEMVHGIGGFDTELMRILSGNCIAKRGAMGMYLSGIVTSQHGPVGVAVELDDGDNVPMPPVVLRVLDRIGAISDNELLQLDKFRSIRLKNWNGIDVGEIVSA